jgi:hypothetical protein
VPNPDPADIPRDIPRPLFTRRPEFLPAPAPAPVEPTPPSERPEPFHPQYVSLHALREHGHGPRNLAWGVVTLFLSLVLVGGSLFLAGPKALLTLLACLLTFTALFVLARLHVFRQRNGGFLALGIVCLFGTALPLIEVAYGALETFIKTRPLAPAAPLSTSSPAIMEAGSVLTLTDAFALTPPDPKAGPRVKVVKDARVNVEGKIYLARAGDVFAFASRTGRDVTIAARDLLVTLPGEAVEILDEKTPVKATAADPTSSKPAHPALDEAPPANETPQQITARSQREAIQRYPALGVKGSLENQMFVSLYTEMRQSPDSADFFQNPEWPIELAELLAKREHWQRGVSIPSTGPVDPVGEPSPDQAPPQ